MACKIKKILIEDWEQYRALRLEALKNESGAYGRSYETEIKRTGAEWRKRLGDPDRFFIGAVNNEEFVASAGVFKDKNGEWNLIALYVKPEFRRQGLASKLIVEALTEARQRGIKKIFLHVAVERKGAISLYRKLGFEDLQITENQLFGDGKLRSSLEMVKVL